MRKPLLAIFLALTTCDAEKAPLAGRFAGCDQVDDGPSCVIARDRPAAISVWFEAPLTRVDTALDGETIPHVVHGATRVELALAAGAAGLLTVVDGRGRFALSIRHERRARPGDVATGTTARALIARGDWERAVELLDRSSAAHDESGARSDSIRDLQAAAYALVFRGHRPAAANERLDRAEAKLERYPEGWALQPYYRALVARAVADPRGALDHLQTAKHRLSGLGLFELALGAEEVESHVLAQLGRNREAEALLRRIAAAKSGTPCTRARRINNLAWPPLVEADRAGTAVAKEVSELLDEARALYETPACRGAPGREILLLHLAYRDVLSGELDRAEKWIEQSASAQPGLEASSWRDELIARIALGRGRDQEALAALDRAIARAQSALTLDSVWRLETWRARVHRSFGRRDSALAAYARAERVLDDGILRVPFDEGRGAFLADRSASANERASLLLEAGRVEEAACVLRSSRARAFMRTARGARVAALSENKRAEWSRELGELRRLRATLEERAVAAWDLPAEERAAFERSQQELTATVRAHLSSALALVESGAPPVSCAELKRPAPGELLLSIHPLKDELVAFAIGADAIRALRLDHHAEVLAAFDAELAAADRVRLSTSFALHTASWRGRPLNASKIVVYALDVLEVPVVERDEAPARSATLVLDPTRNLAGARSEGETAFAELSGAGWRVAALEGRQATPSAVRQAIESSALFHYAGHARAKETVSELDALTLHGGALDAEQILLAEAAPRWVVLAGCRTSMPEIEGGPNLSLAHAFLLAGAEQVLASTDDVGDRLAAELAAELYRDARLDLGAAFQRVIAAEVNDPGRWSAFRVWVR